MKTVTEQEAHDEHQATYKECCMLLGNLDPKQMKLILELIKQLSQ